MKESNNPLQVRTFSYASLNEVWKFIKELGISKVDLSMKDIETLMETLVFDGKAESKVSYASQSAGDDEDSLKHYRICGDSIGELANGLMRTPCGGCPVIIDCKPGGVISPEGCIYLKQWLDF